jgi:hypothetical protein
MDVKGFGFSLAKNVTQAGVVGLCYSAYYKLDKKLVTSFFVGNAIVGVCLSYLTGVAQAYENVGTMFESRTTAIELAKKFALFAGGITVCCAIQTIVGRQLGIYGTKATILMVMNCAGIIGGAGWIYFQAKNASEEQLLMISRTLKSRYRPVGIR